MSIHTFVFFLLLEFYLRKPHLFFFPGYQYKFVLVRKPLIHFEASNLHFNFWIIIRFSKCSLYCHHPVRKNQNDNLISENFDGSSAALRCKIKSSPQGIILQTLFIVYPIRQVRVTELDTFLQFSLKKFFVISIPLFKSLQRSLPRLIFDNFQV